MLSSLTLSNTAGTQYESSYWTMEWCPSWVSYILIAKIPEHSLALLVMLSGKMK